MIEAHKVSKRFGPVLALDDASFRVERGQVAAFLGLNGAGKSTTLRIISCFLPPTSGRVSVGGHDTVRQSDDVRRLVGYLPEGVPLYGEMRVGEYLRYRARLKGLRGATVKPAVERALSRMSLGDRARSPIGTLSKGLRQRVGFADALVNDPELLILDEPTSGLDPDQRREVRDLIRAIGAERTVLLSTHILPEAEAVCDRIIVIHGGRVKAEGSLDEMRSEKASWEVRYDGAVLAAHHDRSGVTIAGAARGQARLRVTSEDQASALVAEAVEAGRAVRELTRRADSLEEVFARLTTGREEGHA